MKKKSSVIIIACVLLLGILTACSFCEHTQLTWKGDKVNHWQECECGKVLNTAAHTLDDYGHCDACNMAVVDYEDGNYDILTYDEHGTMNGCVGYDSEGNTLYTQELRYEYYEDGNTKSYKEYLDGQITCEATFLYDSTGKNVYENETVFYEEDGTKNVNTYNENSMLTNFKEYDAEGNILNEDVYDYTYNDAGNVTKQTCTSNGILSSEAFYETDADGNSYIINEVFYDEHGNVISDYDYGEAAE